MCSNVVDVGDLIVNFWWCYVFDYVFFVNIFYIIKEKNLYFVGIVCIVW